MFDVSNSIKSENKQPKKGAFFLDLPSDVYVDLYDDAPRRASSFDSINDVFDAVFEPVLPSESANFGVELDNRGATFPRHWNQDSFKDDEGKIDLRKSVSARWQLKHEVVGILRSNPKADGSTYAVCGCGYGAVFKNDDGDLEGVDAVDIYRRNGRVGVSGALRCNSPWLCPSCAPGRAEKRRQNLEEVFDRTSAMQGVTAFVTLTIRHKKNDTLADLKRIQSTASRKARQGRAWLAIKEKAQILGVVQGVEVLHNLNTGWHYHAHIIIPCLTDNATAREAMHAFVARYIECVRAEGGDALERAQDVKILVDAETNDPVSYVTKGSASWEIAGSLKEARDRKSRTPWDLVKLASAGDESAKSLFLEYSENIVGTRSCVISPSLAKALMMDVPDEDDDNVDADFSANECDDTEIVVSVLTDSWRKLMSYGVAWRVINAVELGQDTASCEAIVCELLGDIKQREWKIEKENRADQNESKNEYLSVGDVIYHVIEFRKMGMSASDAKIKSIKYLKDHYRKSGKNAVMPDESDVDMLILHSRMPDGTALAA